MIKPIIVLIITGIIGVVWRQLSPSIIIHFGDQLLIAYLALACGLLSRFAGVLLFSSGLVSIATLAYVNQLKIDLTQMPLTLLDFQIALANPQGLWEALGFPAWTRYITYTFLFFIFSILIISTGRAFFRMTRTRGGMIYLSFSGAIVLIISLEASHFTKAHFAALQPQVVEADEVWEPKGVARLADKIGVISFLSYYYYSMSQHQGDIFDESQGSARIDQKEIETLLSTMVLKKPDRGQRPNVIFMLAESTFNPNDAFQLKSQLKNDLFLPNRYTKFMAPLRVNAVGGGTWITEFEVITGLDSRLFGSSGYYTHSAVSPYIKDSFVTYLNERGYETIAIYSTGGDFYNARNAYRHYGFSKFIDSVDLGNGKTWTMTDSSFIEQVLNVLGTVRKDPFFAFAVTVENHAPHDCIHYNDAEDFDLTFAGKAGFDRNCEINEYILRLGSTANAMSTLLKYLASVERKTGRPFVLVVFGDHQPHTFTDTGGANYDYSEFRTDSPINQTFVHIMSSIPTTLSSINTPVSAAVLPSLASIFVADSYDDLFLKINLFLWVRCGVDPLSKQIFSDLKRGEVFLKERSEDCRVAYDDALTRYRVGIIPAD